MEPPPPAYSGQPANPPPYDSNQKEAHAGGPPPPSYVDSGQQGAKNNAVYWSYWGVLFATLLTWAFAVAATAHDELLDGYSETGYEDADDDEYWCDYYDLKSCEYFDAAKACQYLSTVLVSIVLVLVLVAAFMPAPTTGRLGLAAGILLIIYAVFQLVAFSMHAVYVDELDEETGGFFDLSPGPNFALAIVAFIFGLAGGIVTLALFKRATTDQDGPFKQCCCAAQAGAPGSTATV